MRKWMLAGLGLLLVLPFGFGAYARTIENETVATGTVDIVIDDLRGGYKILTIHPWTQNVIVSILDKDGNAIEDYTVEAGQWRNVDISGMGTATIGRAVATIVDWGISVDRDANIGGSSWNSTATDELTAVTTDDGIWLDPDWSTEILASNLDLDPTESYSTSWSMDGYTACYAVYLADTWSDSLTVVYGTSTTLGWTAGNTAYFDMNPFGTVAIEGIALNDSLGTYGTCLPILNSYGTWIPGPYGCLTITNNLPVGTAEDDSALVGCTIVIQKRK